MALKKLTAQQKVFCEAYAENGGIGYKAAIAAGYKETDAMSRASILLSSPLVAEYLKSITDKLCEKKIARIQEIQAFWTIIVRGNMLDDGYPAKLSDRIKASELLARSQGAFIEKLQLSGAGGESIPAINLNFIKPQQYSLDGELT